MTRIEEKMADTSKYKSVSINTDNWKLATMLTNIIIPNNSISRAKVVQIALSRLADEYELDLVEVSPKTLKQTNEEKHASNN